MNEVTKAQDTLPQRSPIKRAATNPFTIIPVVGGGVSLALAISLESFLFGLLTFMSLSAALTIFIILSIVFSIGSAVKKKTALTEDEAKVKKLNKELRSDGDSRAAQQATHIHECFTNFKNRLDERIGEENDEYDHYFEPANDMYEAALRNLKSVARLHDDIKLARVDESRQMIDQLERSGVGSVSDLEIHRRKVRIADRSESKIDELKNEVDNAITVLIEVANQLNDVITDRIEIEKSARAAMKKFNKAAELNKKINEKVIHDWEMIS